MTSPSFWFEQLPERKPRPPLSGVQEADVCIVGAGFTGLWTAYALLRAAPTLKVVVLEAKYVGFGASGRNGGWVNGALSGSAAAWRRRGGGDAPQAMASAIQETVKEIGAVVQHERIDCDWREGGTLSVAQNGPQLERLRAALVAERRDLGEVSASKLLDADELRGRVAVQRGAGALFNPYCARVQPARLVVGLAQAVERVGGVIYEATLVTELGPSNARTEQGRVTAKHVILATEAYTVNLPGHHRTLLPLNSSMLVTEPLDDEVWAELRWAQAETLHDSSHLYTYSQRTGDGRIAIGGRGVPYRFGSQTEREGPVPASTVQELHERLTELFPILRGTGIASSWHGVLGVSRDWCPTVLLDPRTGLGFAGGYAGQGVAAANLAGRTLRDLILGRDTELTRLPWVGTPARNWEPEPLRFVGARGVYRLYREADRMEAATGRSSPLGRFADLVAGR